LKSVSYIIRLFSSETIDRTKTDHLYSLIKNKLTQEETQITENRIVTLEVEKAIQSLGNNKSPGRDGMTTEFYKAFSDKLIPILMKMYNEITENKNIVIPKAFNEGIIKLVYKNNGDKNNLNNYRPISLLNTDYKIFMKILANRIKPIMPHIINKN